MMQNIEGDYDDILKDLDRRTRGIGFTNLHGTVQDDRGRAVFANVGLFSLNEDHRNDCLCSSPSHDDKDMEWSSRTIFNETQIFMDGYTWVVEDPENTHLIRF